jgi:hypothetical protein
MYKHIKSGKSFTDKQTKDYFDKLRRSDDEFARDYAKHEFGKWAEQRYEHIPDSEEPLFAKYAEKYNQLRHEMIQGYMQLCETHKLKVEFMGDKTADEMLGIILEIETATEKL